VNSPKDRKQLLTMLAMKLHDKMKKIKCQLDSGASCNVMSSADYQRLGGELSALGKKKRIMLKFYNGNVTKSMGEATMICLHRNQKYQLVFQIIEGSEWPLISAESCLQMGLLSVHAELTNQVSHSHQPASPTITSLDQLVAQFPDVFQGLGAIPGTYKMSIDPKVTPVQHLPRKIPVMLKEEVMLKVEDLARRKIIVKVTEPTPWVSSIVVVKSEKKLRICIDPRDLNTALKRSHYQLPTIEEILPTLARAKIFSVLDAKDGFWQLRLDEESSKLTTFWTPKGRYRWLRMPFGISTAPEEFQRRMHELLDELEGVEVIADDILVYGCGDTKEDAEQDHDKKLLALMELARKKNLKLNKKKVRFRLTQVTYIGHLLTDSGVLPDPAKIKAVEEMQTPKTIQEVQRFIGFTNYLAKFMPALSQVGEPLRKLTGKDVEFAWQSEQERAFREIKKMATSAPILRYYDVSLPVEIQCDASEAGLGAALLQRGQPVAFASRALTQTEKQYAQIEKECLAIVFGCERFDSYIRGRERITIESDHKPLETIFKKSLLQAPKRLQRMLLRLQRYNITVTYKKGVEMYLADTLSRAFPPEGLDEQILDQEVYGVRESRETQFSKELAAINQASNIGVSDKTIQMIRDNTLTDEALQDLSRFIQAGWPDTKEEVTETVKEYWQYRDELGIQNGVLFKGTKVIVPQKMKPDMLTKIHAAHSGIEASLRRARDVLFWVGMNQDVREKVAMCEACNEDATAQQKEPMVTHETPSRPWERVALDIFHVNGKPWLITVDYYSDFWEINSLEDMTAKTLIKYSKQNFSRYGIPNFLDTDKGSQMDCVEYRTFAQEWGFEMCTSSPYYHQSNGKAESAVKIAKRIIKRTNRNGEDRDMAILSWRNTPTQFMESSPVQRLMSRRTRTLLPTASHLLLPQIPEDVKEKINLRKLKYKVNYDRQTKELPGLVFGQNIRVQLNPDRKGAAWQRRTVVRELDPRTYIVDVEGRGQFRRNRVHIRPEKQQQPSQTPDQGPVDGDRARAENSQGISTQQEVASPSQVTTNDTRQQSRRLEEPGTRKMADATLQWQGQHSRSGRRINVPSTWKDFVNTCR
jgi:RNase H-like domain found in reverse transcriptase/Reverse transcriptase (RNA-dependent DNA polymerase)/Integrase zinc binding domain